MSTKCKARIRGLTDRIQVQRIIRAIPNQSVKNTLKKDRVVKMMRYERNNIKR